MWQTIQKNIFQKLDAAYLQWLFPKNKGTLVNGLIFVFITITSLSLVDYFFYAEAYYSELEPAQPKPFGIDSYFRLIFVPFFNIGMIFLAKSKWCNSMKRLESIAGLVILASLCTFLGSGFNHEYYTADDFTFDVLVLVIFAQTLLGLTFRMSFFFNLFLVFLTITYIWIDELEIKIQMYNTTILLLVWVPVLLGTWRLELAKQLNFKTIFKLKESNEELGGAHQEVAEQKELLRGGERVSKLASWRTSPNLKRVFYSEGIYDIYEFDRAKIKPDNIFLETHRLVHPEDLERTTVKLQQLQQGKIEEQVTEHRILLPNGRIKWLRTTYSENSKGKGLIGTIQDITKSKTLEIELQSTLGELKIKNEELQQFAYASSHDLQEPLRTITNFGNILELKMKDRLEGDERVFLNYILQSTSRMSDLIHAILDYSRIGRNKTTTTFDCNEVVADVLRDLHFSIEKTDAVVKVRPLPTVVGYKSEFSLLLQNLIGNALKFSRLGVPPIINISCQSNESHYKFRVKDNGIGIDQKYVHKIFQLFSRLHGKEDYEGTGIGLTHSKKIVELHGGKIWLESQNGEGTIFCFTISKSLKLTANEKEIELYYAH